MAAVRIEVKSWSFWSPEGGDPEEWLRHWSQAGARSKEGEPDVAAIPPMQRRRMSRLSKMAISAALDVAADLAVDYSIFCSQHGEIARTRQILASISEATEISPTAFAQSVHNTSSGLFTILEKSNAPSTSVASGANTFACGWMDAQAYLGSNPDHTVLLVDFDEVIPDEYQGFIDQVHGDHALALLLVAADQGGIGVEQTPCGDISPLPQGPQFLAWLQSGEESLRLSAERQGWQWQR